MITVKKNQVVMTRGDTLITTVTPYRTNEDGSKEPYIPVEGDTLQFALKHPTLTSDKTEYVDTEPLVVKSIPTDTLELRLDPADTKSLGFGDYEYEISLTFADGTVDTFIAHTQFTLDKEVN